MNKAKKVFLQNSAVMEVSCMGCDKKFSTNVNRNKHERTTGNGPKNQKVEKPICYNSFNNQHLCPTENCEISVITKRSIKRHLKNCKKIMHNNKVCQCCHKTFLKKSNRDRHVKQFLENSNNTKCEDIDLNVNDREIDKEFPTVQCIDRCNVWFWC